MQRFKVTGTLSKFADIKKPGEAEEPILAQPVRAAVHEWMTETWASDDLSGVGIQPRRTAMLYGPPGCGKTTLAHHFAARLGLPMVIIKMDTVVSAYLGSTGQTIAAIFNDLAAQECGYVLFMDEFDSIASKRSDDKQSASRERNAIVNSLLTRIEAFEGLAIAATNRGDQIDPALWRRFGMHLDVALPTFDERFAILRRYLMPFELLDSDLDVLASVTDGASPALLRQLMEGVKRALVLNPRLNRPTDAGTVFSTLVASTRPHPDYEPPPLWADAEALNEAVAINWPPTRPARREDAAA